MFAERGIAMLEKWIEEIKKRDDLKMKIAWAVIGLVIVLLIIASHLYTSGPHKVKIGGYAFEVKKEDNAIRYVVTSVPESGDGSVGDELRMPDGEELIYDGQSYQCSDPINARYSKDDPIIENAWGKYEEKYITFPNGKDYLVLYGKRHKSFTWVSDSGVDYPSGYPADVIAAAAMIYQEALIRTEHPLRWNPLMFLAAIIILGFGTTVTFCDQLMEKHFVMKDKMSRRRIYGIICIVPGMLLLIWSFFLTRY